MHYRFAIAFLIFLFIGLSDCNSQNLLANSSFEDANYCEGKIPCSPAGWFSVSNWPSGYFKNIVQAFHGEQSLGFVVASGKGKLRNYWQTRLLCKPPEAEQVVLKFMLYPVQNLFNPVNFGFAFAEHTLKSEQDTLLQLNNYINLSKASIRKTKSGWYEVELSCFVPSNGNYLLLGNFDTSTTTKVKYEEYYLDKISLVPSTKIKCDIQASKDSLYSITHRHLKAKKNLAQTYTTSVPQPIKARTDTFSLGVENFELDKAKLSNSTKIDSIFQTIDLASIQSIYIYGYTDKSGSAEYNLKLSQARADVIKDYILTRFVKEPSVLFANGKGISTTYSDDKLNRRVEIVIHYKTKE